jgi:N-acetylmuramoyl-L-alanine amidase
MTMGTPAWMDPKKITDITVHCAATPRGRPFTAGQISAMDLARADLGNQIAYHYVIELDGKTTQTLRHDQRGAHVGGHNTGNLGICYVGGVLEDGKTPADTRTPAQTEALARLVKDLRRQFPRARIRGHRDWPGVAKACPSFDVTAWLASIGLAP